MRPVAPHHVRPAGHVAGGARHEQNKAGTSAMSIDTLIAAAEYIEDTERKRRQPAPQQQQPPQQQQQQVVLHQVLRPHVLAANVQQQQQQRKKDGATQRIAVMNSFDLLNPAVLDQGSGEMRRKQPPMAFRTGTREVHNKLEKNRRAHLKDCFEDLFAELPNAPAAVAAAAAAKKTSNLNILDSALKYIEELRREAAASEGLIEQLAKQKIGLNQRCATLRKEIKSLHNIDVPEEDVGVVAAGGRKRTKSSQMSSPTEKLDRIALGDGEATPLAAGTTTTTTTTLLPKSISAATPKDVGVGDGGGGGGGAFAFGGGLVLVPQQQALTAQFVAARHPGADGKVIVNAKYLVKPLVVVSTPSRPS